MMSLQLFILYQLSFYIFLQKKKKLSTVPNKKTSEWNKEKKK